MTDEPTDDLEQRLRRDLGEIADAVPVGEPAAPPAAKVVPITATTERRKRPVLAVAGVVGAAAALLIGVLIWQSDDDGPGENVATQDPATTPDSRPPDAPPAADSPVGFWLSERRIPVDGADLGVVLAGRSEDKFGAAASVDRWNGAAWERVRFAAPCLDHWHCIGELRPASSPPDVPSISFSLDEGGLGELMLLHIEDLEPGWYRLLAEGDNGDTAEGQFEVVDEELALPEFGDVSGDRLLVRPPFVATAGSLVDVALSRSGSRSPDEVLELESSLSSEARFLRWVDGAWTEVAKQPITTVPQAAEGEGLFAIEIPDLEPGAYQVVRDGADGSSAVGLLWAISPQAPAPTQAAAPSSSTTTVPPEQPVPEGCPTLDSLEGATVRGESLQPDLDRAFPGAGEFGATDGGREVAAATDTLVVLGAQPVRPVIDFVGERTAQEGPILLWWADTGRVEAWVTVDGCDRVGMSVEGDKRDRNATAAYELALHVADRAVALMVAEQPEPCPDPGAQPSGDPTLFLYCPADDVDQVPVRYPAQAPPSTPTEALQALFRTDPPPGWGTGVPLQMRGADVDVVVTDGVARVIVDYDFEGAPINNFSTSFMSIAYGNQLQATLFQFPEIDAIDLDTLCCGEWGGLVTRAEWETWLAQATQE